MKTKKHQYLLSSQRVEDDYVIAGEHLSYAHSSVGGRRTHQQQQTGLFCHVIGLFCHVIGLFWTEASARTNSNNGEKLVFIGTCLVTTAPPPRRVGLCDDDESDLSAHAPKNALKLGIFAKP